jgi:hypothetical protein
MSEFTRPTAMISYAAAVGTVASTIYLNNRINETCGKLNNKITELNEDIGVIRDGVKEKIPMLEKGLSHLANDIKSVIGAVNNHSMNIKKLNKMEKRLVRCMNALEETMSSLSIIENRQINLINALSSKGALEGAVIETPVQTAPVQTAPKPVIKHKRPSRLLSSDEESESSEDEKRRSKKQKKNKNKSRGDSSDDDEDEVERVARLASRK